MPSTDHVTSDQVPTPTPEQRREVLTTFCMVLANFVIVMGLDIVAIANIGNQPVFFAVIIPTMIYALATGIPLMRRWRRVSRPPVEG